MNELELLTDEERLTYEQNNDPRVAMLSWGQVHKLFSALIAARAENKRLLQKIEALVHVWDSNTRDYRMPLAVSNLRALLQSEKESE